MWHEIQHQKVIAKPTIHLIKYIKYKAGYIDLCQKWKLILKLLSQDRDIERKCKKGFKRTNEEINKDATREGGCKGQDKSSVL